MNVLVIGGSGFIGLPLLRALVKKGHRVALLRRGRTPAVLPDGIQEITGDRNHLAESLSQLRSFSPEVVVDLIVSSEKQAKELIQAFPHAASRMVLISSMDVYRAFGVLHGIEPGPPDPLPLTEDSSLRQNLHVYSRERLKTMRAVFSWIDDDYDKIPAERVVLDQQGTVLRLPMVYGPGDPLHRFHGIVKRIQDGRDKIVFSEPMAHWRSPRGYVDNVADAIALAAESDRAAGRVYNIAEPEAFSELQWARRIAGRMEWHGEFVVLPPERVPRHLMPPGNTAQHLDASSQRIREELAYRETVPVDIAISRTIEWESANPPSGISFHQFDYAAEDAALAA
jgi:nucleoside-diphosphate-sugar epimerase